MERVQITNVNVVGSRLLPSPEHVKQQQPLTEKAAATVVAGRRAIQDILDGKDRRLFVVVGPCSIHDVKAATDYAERLRELADRVRGTLFLVLRVYFEKPRTTTGWKGLINDPHLDDSFRIEEGIALARSMLLRVAEMGLAAGTEALDPITPQFLGDLVSWSAIGARTTESQTHREMASGLSTPVGFKNNSDGRIQVAIDALKSVRSPHRFLGIDFSGHVAVFETRGNAYGHVVLRGGHQGPNYDSVHVALCERALEEAGLRRAIMVDCSHGNSNKEPALQPLVLENCVNQILGGNTSIVGLMLESNLERGNQSIPHDPSQLRYGVSVTDACLDWPATERALIEAHRRLAAFWGRG